MEDLIGKKIENYQIISVLGRGGMGVVYKAHDEKLDRFVAIKVLSVKAVDKQKFIDRFKREAKNHAQLSHPNIVVVFGFIEYEGLLGIVMEYVNGESLETVIFKNFRLHIFDVVYIIKQVLLAIGYAHSKGFVHRDIKPSNIILNTEGTVKIMDFGISKSLFSKEITQTSSKVGTVYYMSPEQIKGDDIDHLTDIYAIGVTIYEMLVGKPPFFAESEFDIMEGHLKKEPTRLSLALPGVPVTLDEIVFKCLRKNPKERYLRCNEILDKLHEMDDFIRDVKSKYFLRTKKNPRRTKVYSIVATAVLVMGFFALVYFVFIQVGDLLESKTLDAYKKYNIETLFEDDKNINSIGQIMEINTGSKNGIHSLQFISDSFGFTVGDSSSYLNTSDKGKTWALSKTENFNNLRDLYLFASGKSFIIGDHSFLAMSSNFFKDYKQLKIEDGYNLYSINFLDNIGFIVGSKGLILKSVDGGFNWKKAFTDTEKNLFDVKFINKEKAFAVGWEGVVLKTNDFGDSWVSLKPFTKKYLRAIDFADEKIGVICGGAGSIFRTLDGGDNWEQISTSQKEGLNDIKILNTERMIIVGAKGIILFSKDQGENWEKISTNNYSNLTKISVSNSGNIFVSSSNGSIIKIELDEKE